MNIVSTMVPVAVAPPMPAIEKHEYRVVAMIDRTTLVLTFRGLYAIEAFSILLECSNLGLTQHAYKDCSTEKTSAITDAARLPGVPIETSRIPNAHVRRGLSQNVALRVLEGLKPVNACHENPKIPAQAVEERTNMYHFSSWKRWVLAADSTPRTVRKITRMEIRSK